MTRYEFFETWLYPEEWKEWKIHSVKRFKQLHSVTTREAREVRKRYLNSSVHFTAADRRSVLDEWDDMTNRHLRWMDTSQGHNHWSNVNSRTAPCRTIEPRLTRRRIHNTPN